MTTVARFAEDVEKTYDAELAERFVKEFPADQEVITYTEAMKALDRVLLEGRRAFAPGGFGRGGPCPKVEVPQFIRDMVEGPDNSTK